MRENHTIPCTEQIGRLAVDIHEAGRILGVCARTIRREIDRDNLKAFKVGRVWRVRITAIGEYMARLEQRGGRP